MASMVDELDGAASVLVKGPAMGDDRDICRTLLTEGVSSPGIIFVTYTHGAGACLDRLGDAATDANNIGVITVGDVSTAEAGTAVQTSTVSSPSDLTGLGIEIGELVDAWPAPVTVCLDSLTTMLQYVDFETAYEFLHTLTGRIHAADARAHYHVDPAAHDPAAVAALASLMDAVVDLDDELVVRTRESPQ
jgi:hypothetical protein